MNEQEPPQETDAAAPPPDERRQFLLPHARRLERWLSNGEEIIQVGIGLLLFFAALYALGYTVYNFLDQFATASLTFAFPAQNARLSVEQNAVEALIDLISDILLVLIIVEIFSTVLHYLRSRAISLKPFLFIGIISATRGILVISASVVILDGHGEDFAHAMIELGVNLGIVLGLSLALRLLRKEDTIDTL